MTVSTSETAGSGGSVTFDNLDPSRTRTYTFSIEGTLPDDSVVVRWRFYIGKQYSVQETQTFCMHNTKLTHKPFLLYTGTIDDCRAHLINDGITVNEDSVTIEWQGTGPGANASPPLGFECRLRAVTNYEQCMFVEESNSQ